MKIKKLIYITALLAGCTNVNSDDKIIWKGQKDSCSNRFIARPYWYYGGRFTPLNSEERTSLSRGESVESVSERGGFGRTGIAHEGGTGE